MVPYTGSSFNISPGCAYSFTRDNIQKLKRVKHQGTWSQNEMMEWAMMFATDCRVPTLHLSSEMESFMKARDVLPHNFLINTPDRTLLRDALVHRVWAIVTSYLPELHHLSDGMPCVLPHTHSSEVRKIFILFQIILILGLKFFHMHISVYILLWNLFL